MEWVSRRSYPTLGPPGCKVPAMMPVLSSLAPVSYQPVNKKGLLRPPCNHFLCVISATIHCNAFFPSVTLEGQLKLPIISGCSSQAAEGKVWYAEPTFTSSAALIHKHFWMQLQATGNWRSEPRQMQCSHCSERQAAKLAFPCQSWNNTA